MKLTLTTNDGEVIEQWDVEDAFGDMDSSMARALMAMDIAAAVRRQKEKEANNGAE